MAAAEKLYQQGIISYPRTETDMFNSDFDLKSLLQAQTQHGAWGRYASNLLDESNPTNTNFFLFPRRGRKNDNAHPPIHPTKAVELDDIANPTERTVYEFVTRHFLACCSRDAKGNGE